MAHHGLLLVNKPTGPTSHDVVHRARKALGTRDIGHAGTLDPLASGLMVLLLGEATKISDYVLNGDKAYLVRVKLGVTTDSLDITGRVLSEKKVQLDPQVLSAAAMGLQGVFNWPVPVFSAVKTGGKKLYEFAHQDKAPPVIPKKDMKFWGVEVVEVTEDTIYVSIHCSKGSYIRTWAAQLGEVLGVGGAVETLQRTISAPYSLTDAIRLEDLELHPEAASAERGGCFVPLAQTLTSWKTLTVKGKDERLIHNGQISHDLERRLILEQKEATQAQQVRGIKVLSADSGLLLAILEALPNHGLKIRRVFKMS
jgi:tRNA pseudouridine55 synthase